MAFPLYVDACCSGIRLVNVSNASVSSVSMDLNFQTNLSGINGITIQKSFHVHIQMDVFCTVINNFSCVFAVLALKSTDIFVDGMQANNLAGGIALVSTNDITITNSAILNNMVYGIRINDSNVIHLLNTTVTNGMSLHGGTNIQRNTLVHIQIVRCTKATIINSVFSFNRRGISFSSCNDTHMRNITSYSNNNYDVDYGIHMNNCIRTKITYVYFHSIELYTCNYTHIYNALLTSKRQGIRIIEGHKTYLVNISIANEQRNGTKQIIHIGIQGESSSNITLKNVSVASFRRSGLDFYDCKSVTLMQSRFSALYSTTTGQHLLQSAIVSLNGYTLLCLYEKQCHLHSSCQFYYPTTR